jgi:hypothetical protein
MVTRYIRPALLVIAAAVAATTAQSLWNVDRTRAILLVGCAALCMLVAVARIVMARR